MKLRALICLLLAIVVISDVTTVAATNYTVRVSMRAGKGHFISPSPALPLFGILDINNHTMHNRTLPRIGWVHNNILYDGPIDTITLRERRGVHVGAGIYRIRQVIEANFNIYHNGALVASGTGLGNFTVNLPCPAGREQIPFRRALNFTLAAATTIPVMTIGIVDDIMLTVGKFINCGLTKFVIRAALLKLAAKGVAVVAGITAVSYLLGEFADDIYNAIFTTVPAVQPGDTHFHKNDLPQVMGIIHSYFPTHPHIT